MSFPAYRSIMTLTDDEICEVMKLIYPSMGTNSDEAAEIVEIARSDDMIDVTCRSAWHDCDDDTVSWCEEYFELAEGPVIHSYDIGLTHDEVVSVKKYLLSLGCNELLKDNSFI